MNLDLWELRKNTRARIIGFKTEMPREYSQRLRELGFDKETEITCERRSLLGGPRTYIIGDSVISLESSLGRLIEVEEI